MSRYFLIYKQCGDPHCLFQRPKNCQPRARHGQCTISIMIPLGRLNYWVLDTRFRASTKNVVRMPCDTEKNARKMLLLKSPLMGTRVAAHYIGLQKDQSTLYYLIEMVVCVFQNVIKCFDRAFNDFILGYIFVHAHSVF